MRPLDAIASAIVPPVADAVDPDELLDRIDVNALLERINVDALLERIDAIVGLKAVQGDGMPLKPGHAFVRTLVLPFSFVLFGIGALMVLVDPRRRALQDVAAKSAVVYDWGDRPAALPAPLTKFLDKRESVTLEIAPQQNN